MTLRLEIWDFDFLQRRCVVEIWTLEINLKQVSKIKFINISFLKLESQEDWRVFYCPSLYILLLVVQIIGFHFVKNLKRPKRTCSLHRSNVGKLKNYRFQGTYKYPAIYSLCAVEASYVNAFLFSLLNKTDSNLTLYNWRDRFGIWIYYPGEWKNWHWSIFVDVPTFLNKDVFDTRQIIVWTIFLSLCSIW